MSDVAVRDNEIKHSALIKTRAPVALRDAVKRAAGCKMTSGSEYVRQAILERLKADGVPCDRWQPEAA
jgi:hypothetical protein